MFSSGKIVWVAIGMHCAVVFLPGVFLDSVLIPHEYMSMAMIACALFTAGICAGALLFPFSGRRLDVDSTSIGRGFVWVIIVQTLLTAYVFTIGPESPLLSALTLDNALDVALLREDALKLNQDPIFVRVYSWGRDIVGPVTFVFSVHALRFARARSMKLLAVYGVLLALALGLWSGQKATVINYLLAAVIFSAANGWTMTRQLIKTVPVLVVVAGVIFALTLPQYFSGQVSDEAFGILAEAILHRVLLSPLEVAAAYIYAIDLRIVSAFDVLPLATELWTPGLTSIENRVALEFFYSGIDSASANALAFAYAYVLAGYAGCFAAGVLVVAVYRLCMWLVQSAGSQFMFAAFGAMLSYQVLDLLNSNYLAYLLTSVLVAATFWTVGSLLRPRTTGDDAGAQHRTASSS